MALDSQTAHLVINAALPLFGARGLDGTSTREIAAAAGKPMSAITYHFGGKDGLYRACATHIGDTIGGFVAATLDAHAARANPADKAQARADIRELIAIMIQSVLRPEMAHFARFIMREQQEPTEAFEIIYSGMMGRMLARTAALIEVISAPPMPPMEAKVRALAIMGQVLVFRVAHAGALRLTGWTVIGDSERSMIARIVDQQIDAILDGLEGDNA